MADGDPEQSLIRSTYGQEGAELLPDAINEGITEENILRVQRDLIELAAKVTEYREKGPAAFALLLEESLSKMRYTPQADAVIKNSSTSDSERIEDEELLARRAALLERSASATAQLPTILRRMKSQIERVNKAMKARNQSPTKNLSQHQLEMPSSVSDI